MRILYVAPRYHTNQIPIMRGLKREGHDICFLSQYVGKVEDYADVTPVVVGYSRFFRFFDACYVRLMGRWDKSAGDRKIKCGFPPMGKLKRLIVEYNPDVVILRERSVYSVFAYRVCRKFQMPAILYNQSPLWEDRIKNDLPHRLMRRLTPSVRMTPVLGKTEEGKVTEPGAVFVPFVMEPVMPPEQRDWCEDGIIHLFCIGKYEKRKNHQMLVEVIEELVKQMPVHLTVAGECSTPVHQSYYDGLEVYIRSHGLEDRVELLANLKRTQVWEQYRKADLFVIPSTAEPASISQLEAMAFSLPVICSDKNGTACYVKNGENGWQFQDNDKEDLKRTILKIICCKEEMMRMGTQSYRFVTEKYQINTYLEGIQKLLDVVKAGGA